MMRLGLLSKLHLAHGRSVTCGAVSFDSRLAISQTAVLSPSPRSPTPTSVKSFTSTRPFREDGSQARDLAARGKVRHKPQSSDRLGLKTIQISNHAERSAKEAPKTDFLLGEQKVSNKEQRKADWAILKEMSKYLWPKVCQSVDVMHSGLS